MNHLVVAATVLFLAGCSGHSSDPVEDAPTKGELRTAWHDEPEFLSCMDAVDLGAFKNSQWLACHEAALERFDGALNRAYAGLQQKLNRGDDIRRLREAQRGWIEYRNSYCKFAGGLDLAPTPEINHTACLVELTAEQTQRLSEAY